jgi:hypothetical protein
VLFFQNSFDDTVYTQPLTLQQLHRWKQEKVGKNNNTKKKIRYRRFCSFGLCQRVFYCYLLFFATAFIIETRWSSSLSVNKERKTFCVVDKSRKKWAIDYINRWSDLSSFCLKNNHLFTIAHWQSNNYSHNMSGQKSKQNISTSSKGAIKTTTASPDSMSSCLIRLRV